MKKNQNLDRSDFFNRNNRACSTKAQDCYSSDVISKKFGSKVDSEDDDWNERGGKFID